MGFDYGFVLISKIPQETGHHVMISVVNWVGVKLEKMHFLGLLIKAATN